MTPTPPTPRSQAGRILAILRGRLLCASEIYRTPYVTHRLAARIYDLRQAGYTITTERCRIHNHDSHTALYRLESR